MNRKEIDIKKQELVEILQKDDAGERLRGLQRLAQEVGASITRMEKVETQRNASGYVNYKNSNEITETEIVHNIQVALQTETMIDMSKITARNCMYALIATIIAFLALVATWIMILVKLKGFEI